MIKNALLSWLGCLLLIAAGPSHGAPSRDQVTILYDAFSNKPGVEMDWGFAALPQALREIVRVCGRRRGHRYLGRRELHTPSGSAVDSLMTVTATEEFTDCT